jgi:hypothetical protein
LDVSRDVNGTDMATARLLESHPEPTMPMAVASATPPAPLGTEVFTFGYPLTAETADSVTGEKQWELHPRYLRGYITRDFKYARPGFARPVLSYEIDMPAPEGLSGAPLIQLGTTNVLGVVYGVNEVQRIAEFATTDPATGSQIPEVLRIERFALAEHTESLRDLAGTATDAQPLHTVLPDNPG